MHWLRIGVFNLHCLVPAFSWPRRQSTDYSMSVACESIRQATKLALLLRARADFSLFLENFKRGRVSARARVIDLHYSLSYVHVCAILSKDPSSGG